MAHVKVYGSRRTGINSQLPLLSEDIPLKDAVEVAAGSRDANELLDLPDVNATDVVEVELEDGTLIWMRVDALREMTRDVGQRGDSAEVLPSLFPLAGADRGLVSWVIKSLKFFDFDIAKHSALKVAQRIESQLAGPEGIYRIDANGELTRDAIQPGSEPVLLFIHGTASSTRNAYGGLMRTPPPESDNPAMTEHFRQLHAHYGGRVYGFEHKTLTETPAANALSLLQALPRAHIPPLHVVSHSRGGLVGDLLAHGGIDDAFPEAALAAYQVPEEQRATYRSLSQALGKQKPQVERFIRIACPAAGTTLASGRLDIYLSILVNLVGKIPALGPFVEGFGDLVAAVAKERANPSVLPGLAAQMPTSALIRALNGSGLTLDTDLTVIAGNSGGFIKNLANLFYWTANDLVVDTRSMYGGAQRSQRLWYCAEGAEVDHVSYFRREETVTKLVHGLTREPGDTSGFETGKPKGAARAAAQRPQDNPEKPCVILLPGIMGSHLAVVEGNDEGDRDRIWLDPKSIMFGGIKHLDLTAQSRVQPDGLISLAYGDLIDYLRSEGGQHVIPCAYDWRLSVRQAAQRLDEIISTRIGVSSAPIRIVAHSMGGLVARAYIAQQGERWHRLVRQHDARLIQLGTPNGGSYVIPRILLGQETILRQLAALDLASNIEQWARIVAQFPGLLEMAPQNASHDFFEASTWSQFAEIKALPSPEALTAARTTVAALAGVTLSEHPVIYVAGHAATTPTLVQDGGSLRLGETPDGDGRVTWQSGIPQGVPTYYMPVEHGNMADHEDSFAGIRELIETGETGQFERNPLKPIGPPRRGLGPLAEDGADIFPDQRQLVTAALGMSAEHPWTRAKPDDKRPFIAIEVAHGDLAFARYPVMIGHYAGDTIMSAEAQIDRSLGGKLSQRNQLDLYPGAIGTAEVVLRNKATRSPLLPGAIVVGLGAVGTLTRGGLANTVKSGLLRYVQEALDRGENTSALKVSTMLIGSGEAGLTMEQVVESIVTGLELANRRLHEVHSADGQVLASIASLEILELYLDTALQALHAAKRLSDRAPGIKVANSLRRLSGGERRALFSEPGGWWSRIVISAGGKKKPQRLTFRVYGERARADQFSLAVQRPLVDSIIASAIQSSRASSDKLPQTLFELLLPAELKGSAADRQNLVVGVDRFSAQYPWEMLVDRYDESGRPLAVVAGLLRQLDVKDPPAVSHPEARCVLVVGDPPSALPPLPAAAKEAAAVAERFEQRGSDWHVIRLIRHDPGRPAIRSQSIIEEILTSDARILHVAGHGVYDPDNPLRTGAVIGADSNNPDESVLFTPSLVRQMRLTPELVFINCCHLGRITDSINDTPQHRLAANLATGFIEAGVRAVIAAGWAVDDHAAETFAASFYQAILSGATFGDAVRTARMKTHDDHPQTNTWAAYQCYGNPGFQLLADPGVRQRVASPHYEQLLDPTEVEAQLGNLVSRVSARRTARGGSGGGSKGSGYDIDDDDAKAQLDHLKNTARAHSWAERCDVALGIARVHGELGEFAEAIQWFDKARTADDGSVTLRDIEQHANMMARQGGAMADAAEAASREAGRALIDRAIGDIDRILGCGKTAERWAIRGSASKNKLHFITARAQRERLLRSMTASYANAAELGAKNRPYALTNALAGILLLGGPWDEPKQALALASTDQFQRALHEARRLVNNLDISDFWAALADPDLRIIEALHAGTLNDSTGAIREAYLAVAQAHGSPRQVNSVLCQIDLLSKMLSEFKPGEPGPLSTKKARDPAARALHKLSEELKVRIRD